MYPQLDFMRKRPVISPEFVQRMIQLQSGFPVNFIQNPDGTRSTHKMMSFEQDGKFLVAPTIVNQNGKLVELSPKEAQKYAMQNKEYLEFLTETEAQNFAEGGWKTESPEMLRYKYTGINLPLQKRKQPSLKRSK